MKVQLILKVILLLQIVSKKFISTIVRPKKRSLM